MSAIDEDSSKTENRPWKEHHGECLQWFSKRKMWLEKMHQRKCLWLIKPSDLKLYPLKISHYGDYVARKPDFAAVSRTHDKHRLALLMCSCARSFIKSSYPTQCCPAEALAWMTQLSMSAHHEDPSKTANRSWKEQQGKYLRQFLKRQE